LAEGAASREQRKTVTMLFCDVTGSTLHDSRPGWGGGKLNATTLLLEPLQPAETATLIDELVPAGSHLDPQLRGRVQATAGGNPLFVEEMLALLGESGSGEVAVPATIAALLAARLDQLAPAERTVLECGSVEGQSFHQGTVQVMAPEQEDVAGRLMTLVRKDLVRPDRAVLPGEDAFRFRHLLIRDAAYEALAEADRAGAATDALAALEMWGKLPIRYMFDWMALWPLLAMALASLPARTASS
jgi:predicted ATPase